MKLEIVEVQKETTTKPKVIGATYNLEEFCNAKSAIVDFMKQHNIDRVSFTIKGVMAREISLREIPEKKS